jgi:hypothetical protein
MLAFGLATTGCVIHHLRAVPVTQLSLEQEGIQSRRVIFATDTGSVTMKVRRFEYPYVTGTMEAGDGAVQFDVRTAHSADVLESRRSSLVAATRLDLTEAALLSSRSKNVRFNTVEGPVVLAVENVDFPYVEGRLRTKNGLVRIDLRRVREMKVSTVNGAATVMANVGIVAGAFAGVILLVALLKESCPFVYVDRGQGPELVGEAYAGAVLRSIQRDDLLPLPTLPGDRARIQLRNEARETQYTDRVELVLVDHAPDTRVLSTFDATSILVGPPVNAVWIRDGQGRDMTELLSAPDRRLWETDMTRATTEEESLLPDRLEAEFPRPTSGQPVLELVAGNTPWLDLIVGRYFAAMGDRLEKYLALGNDPAAGPGLKRWREREGVDLLVELFEHGAWHTVAVVPTAGPAALRELAVPLPVGSADDGTSVRVRLRSGLGFWRLDRMALSVRQDGPYDIHHLRPVVARASGDRDQRGVVASVDGQCDALSEMGQALDLAFDLPRQRQGSTRDAFLFTNGYYNVHPPVQREWSPLTLMTIRDEPGSFSRFSRDLAREYLRIAQATPVLFPSTDTAR